LIRPCGVGTKANQDASYPFLVQSLYRAGYFTHYAGEGAVKSCKIGYGNEQVDLCTCRTLATFSEDGDTRIVTLDPVTIEFADFSVKVKTIFRLTEGSGEVEIIRKIVDSTDPEADLSIDEYITACYGTTEYPEDMTGIRLNLTNMDKTKSIEYAYLCRESELENVHRAEAAIPQVDTLLSMRTNESAVGYFREGFSFSPMYTLGIRKIVKAKGELRTWLKVAKAS
jgi:hypothetical protein